MKGVLYLNANTNETVEMKKSDGKVQIRFIMNRVSLGLESREDERRFFQFLDRKEYPPR